jgi:hypothetical protein
MFYEIKVPAGAIAPPDLELIHDNPKAAKETLQELHICCARTDFTVLRDGVSLNDEQLDAEIRSYEIALAREDSCHLPSAFRPGRGVRTDDVAEGPDGQPVKVRGPENPADRFDQ